MSSSSKLGTAVVASAPAQVSSLLMELPDSAVSSIISHARQQGWDDVLPLASGEPTFPFPNSALQELFEAESNLLSKYSPFKGYELLLQLIKRKLSELNGIEAGEEELIVVPGGSWALYAAIMAVVNDGDEVLISDPCWEHYSSIIRLARATPTRFRFVFSQGRYTPDLDSLEAAITSRTKAILLNTPLNPSGAMLTRSEAQSLVEWCERRGVWMIVDEEYETFAYGREHFSAGSLSPNVISLYSFSKSFALTGIRLGYIKAPKEIINLMRRLGLYTYMFPPSPSQCMAIGLLKDDYKTYLEGVRQLYEQKMLRLYEQIRVIPGIDCWRVEGGVYLFPKLHLGKDRNAVDDLMREYRLLSVPGDVAGESGVGHIRLFFGLDDDVLDKAAHCLSQYMSAFA